MKKILFLFSALLLNCSDLSVDSEDALKAELPADFKRSDYVNINNDVIKSQVLLAVQQRNRELYPSAAQPEEVLARRKECVGILKEDISFAEKIYTEYMDCPANGWNPNKACKGKYSGNPSYTKVNAQGIETCAIGACWSGGWKETDYSDYDLGGDTWEEYCIDHACPVPVEGVLLGTTPAPSGIRVTISGAVVSKLDYYANRGDFNQRDILDTMLSVVCRFIMPEIETVANAKNYLESFTYDSTLIDRHYFLVGRSEGRPYKYCSGTETVERNRDLHALKLEHANQGSFYDYSRYLYCFDEDEFKIYVTQEGK